MIDTPAYLKKLCEREGLSNQALADRCGLSKVAVWRSITEGWAVKGVTLDAILQRGLRLNPETKEYKKAVALWTKERLHGTGPVKSKMIEVVAGMSAADLLKLQRWIKEEEGRRS
jgi:biotin operon repressor